MPGANEDFGCPPTKNRFTSPLSWMPGPFFTFYTFTLTFSTCTYAFFRKLRRWMPPRLDSRGRRTPAPPSARHYFRSFLSIRCLIFIGVGLLCLFHAVGPTLKTNTYLNHTYM